VIVDGVLVKSCMLLAVQANGANIETVEGLSEDDELTPLPAGLQRASRSVRLLHRGMLMSATARCARTRARPRTRSRRR
jgi:aerobic-type carbon monoxide dehydrogenase small subunit (CoxS/CutS family)